MSLKHAVLTCVPAATLPMSQGCLMQTDFEQSLNACGIAYLIAADTRPGLCVIYTLTPGLRACNKLHCELWALSAECL